MRRAYARRGEVLGWALSVYSGFDLDVGASGSAQWTRKLNECACTSLTRFNGTLRRKHPSFA